MPGRRTCRPNCVRPRGTRRSGASCLLRRRAVNGGHLGEQLIGDGRPAGVRSAQLLLDLTEKMGTEVAGLVEPAPAAAHRDTIGDIGQGVPAHQCDDFGNSGVLPVCHCTAPILERLLRSRISAGVSPGCCPDRASTTQQKSPAGWLVHLLSTVSWPLAAYPRVLLPIPFFRFTPGRFRSPATLRSGIAGPVGVCWFPKPYVGCSGLAGTLSQGFYQQRGRTWSLTVRGWIYKLLAGFIAGPEISVELSRPLAGNAIQITSAP